MKNRKILHESKEVESVPVKSAEEHSYTQIYKKEAEAILDDCDEVDRKFIPVEDPNWRDGYLNGYIIGRKKTEQFKTNPINSVKKDAKYRVGRHSGTVILTVNGQTEIGRIHDNEMALRVCDFLNNDNEAAIVTNPIEVIKKRIKELEGDDMIHPSNKSGRLKELRNILKYINNPIK